jgi:16S rRNA G966 N2-methylase RsmD
MLNKLFPLTDYKKIKYDKEGLYSITNYLEADVISKLILSLYENTNNLSILDGTGGIGGNSISFCKHFSNVLSIEINEERFKMLENNINLYKFSNIKLINTNSIKYMIDNLSKFDIFFFDPPWGGPEYKKKKNIKLKIDNKDLDTIIDLINNKTNNKVIIYKLPFNYDFDQFNSYNYKLFKVNKYFIIMILI